MIDELRTGVRTYVVEHRTEYSYDAPVTSSYGRLCLVPRDVPGQWTRQSRLDIDPGPDVSAEHTDVFGNTTTYIEVHRPHTRLVVAARSLVEVTRSAPDLTGHGGWSWESAAAMARREPDIVGQWEFVLPSRHVSVDDEVRRYAEQVFTPGRIALEGAVDLIHRIHEDFAYVAGVTSVSTTMTELLLGRQGVCQDFAHLGIACLRAMGLPARYVSGYLETVPPPGEPRLQGADASHAWLSVWLPELGWVDLDPTNDAPPNASYVLVGWGRDYGDVTPVRGVVYSDSPGSRMTVSVDVARYAAGAVHDPGTLRRVRPPRDTGTEH